MAEGWRKFTGSSPYPELTSNSDHSAFTYGSKLNRSFRMAWIQGKRDPERERIVLDWINRSVGVNLPLNDAEHAAEQLQDGVILCEFLRSINTHALARKISHKTSRFSAADNLSNFQDGLVALGLSDSQLFPSADLIERKNITTLVNTLAILRDKLTAQ